MMIRIPWQQASYRLRTVLALVVLAVLLTAILLLGSGHPSFAAGSEVETIAAGDRHTCAITTAGGVTCWGDNEFGQLGNGTTTSTISPGNSTALSAGVMGLAAGGSHTCALTTSGGIKCWGDNALGQLGDGTTTSRNTPVDVVGLTSAVTVVATGAGHTCALTASGGVKCWGDNALGQLGDDGQCGEVCTTSVDVVGLAIGEAAISAGGAHSCALSKSGGAKCWGDNALGQLGDDGQCGEVCSGPVDVIGLEGGVAAISAGVIHTCAITTVGGAKCWGDNIGQLGDGTTMSRTTPVDVSGLGTGVGTIGAGDAHSCALGTSGVSCWGDNFFGQLGDETTTSRTTPVDVSGLQGGVADISVGVFHTCVVTMVGGAKCWGDNAFGQLGDDEQCGQVCTTPVDVVGLGQKPTAVPTDSLTPPVASSPTLMPTATGTAVPVPPTATHTATPAPPTATGTALPVPPTATYTATPSSPTLAPTATYTATPAPPTATPMLGLLGDVDCDNLVASTDAALVLQLEAELVATLPCLNAADANVDGRIDSVDATLILQLVAGIIGTLQR